MAIETIESFCSQAVSHMKAGLGPKVLLPTDPAYIVREESYWASNTRLKPACILVPESAEEVSSALKSLVAAQQRFAIRSGGHSPSPGANNMADGVTIDLSHLNTVTFDPATETAHIGAGAKWTGVYEELLKYGRAVAGGRSGDVGVSGLLLGGGSSWMAARYGWACDAVLAFEIVLADGRIVTVDKDSNTDLYQALKGGSNNFGIVTSFVMTALPTGQVWAGIAATPKEAIPEVVDVMYNFTEGNSKHQDSYLMIVIGYFPAFKDNVASTAFLEAKGDANAAEFDGWRKLPKIMDTSKITTIYDMAANITLPPNYHNAWFTLCFANCIFQPISTSMAEHSVAAGGNILGLERHSGNAILFQLSAMMKTAEQAAFAYPKFKAAVQAIKDFADSLDGGLMRDWLYMNYADKSQDVLRSYGVDNVRKMKEVAATYDPDQVFQKLCLGGWKISDVDVE